MADLRRHLLLGMLLGVVVLLALTLLADARQVSRQVLGFDWRLAPLIVAGTLFNYAVRFVKWHYFLGHIGTGHLPRWESARVFLAGFPMVITPGKVGEALKGLWINRLGGTPTARGVTVVLAERVSDGLALLALSALGVVAYPAYWPAFAAVLAGLLAIILLSQFRPLALGLLRWAERLPMVGGYAHHLHEFYEGTYHLFRPQVAAAAVLMGIFAWLGEGVAMYLVLVGLGVPAGAETFSMAVFVLSFSTVIGAVSALPGGLGAAEATIAGMLTLLMGLSAEVSAAATMLIRFATLWLGVAVGLAVWPFCRDLLLGEPVAETAGAES